MTHDFPDSIRLQLSEGIVCPLTNEAIPGFVKNGLARADAAEWGPAYSMVMTEACIHVADVHDRMPVILRRDDWSDWLDGAPDDAGLLCRPYPDLMAKRATDDPWVQRRMAVG